MPKSIVIFASGSGSNAENIIATLHPDQVHVSAVYCNNAQAGVIDRCQKWGVPVRLFENGDLNPEGKVLQYLHQDQPQLLVLAGFLRRIPAHILTEFKTINLHPALLPKFGGKGMFGHHVHQAVLSAKESQSGITFHWVNEAYDEGAVIAQFSCAIDPDETALSLANKNHELEHEHFPKILSSVLQTISE
ncbi:MAG: formyltransferase family protein [Bacteroidia bacterium]